MSVSTPTRAAAPGTGRLMSLDVLRGATIASMMLVNNPGNWDAVYPQLDHAEWNGWTFTDLVFPFFLWIVGVAIPLSTARRLEQGQRRQELFLHVIRRAAIIFGLGLFLNSFLFFIDGSIFHEGFAGWLHTLATNVRIPGVLQRIAVCYLLASGIFLLTEGAPGHLEGPQHETGIWGRLGRSVRRQALAILVLLAGYWGLMLLGPALGFGTAGFEKGANFAQYVDNLVLNGPVIGTHVWKTAKTWDPEGVVSTIPAVATCLFGILCGQLLRSKPSAEAKTAWIMVTGSLLLLAGQVMNVWLPINKNLWTSTYAVFMAGMAMLCFGVCYWLIDVQGWRRWAKPFSIYGLNPITVFVLAGILGRISLAVTVTNAAGKPVALKTFLYEKFFASFASADTAPCFGFLASPKNASLLWALTYVLGLYLVAYVMYRRKWVVKF